MVIIMVITEVTSCSHLFTGICSGHFSTPPLAGGAAIDDH